MKKTLLIFMLLSLNIFANDGAYTMSGNQLVELEKYSGKFDTEEKSYSAYFKNNNHSGCYEYSHNIHPENYSEGDSNTFISIISSSGTSKHN